jgi:hypothetical protein
MIYSGETTAMHAKFEIQVDKRNWTIYCRLSGIFEEPEMRAWAAEYRAATDSFRGRPHLVLADMRGMKPTHPDVAAIMGKEIAYARLHGAVRCAHLSDDVVQRMQAARVARQASPEDDVTVCASTLEEAERVLNEARRDLLENRPVSPASAVARQAASR